MRTHDFGEVVTGTPPAETSAPGEWMLQEYGGIDCEIFPVNGEKNEAGVTPAIANIWTQSGRKIVAAHNAALATLREQLAQAMELLREIRDGEVNEQDEADKFLRDHIPSELSKVRRDLTAAQTALKEIEGHLFDKQDMARCRGMAREALATQPDKI